jgi:hypothetical protein
MRELLREPRRDAHTGALTRYHGLGRMGFGEHGVADAAV